MLFLVDGGFLGHGQFEVGGAGSIGGSTVGTEGLAIQSNLTEFVVVVSHTRVPAFALREWTLNK